MTKTLIILLFITVTVNSCKKGTTFLNKETGVVMGDPDCRLLIKSDSDKLFEAQNYDPYSFKENEKVKFTYIETASGSYCMRGRTIEIKHISSY